MYVLGCDIPSPCLFSYCLDLPGRTHSETNSLPSSPDLQSHKQDASLDQADALEPAYQEPEKPSRWLPASAAGQSRLLSVESQLAAFHEQLQAIEATAKHVEQEYGQAGQVWYYNAILLYVENVCLFCSLCINCRFQQKGSLLYFVQGLHAKSVLLVMIPVLCTEACTSSSMQSPL